MEGKSTETGCKDQGSGQATQEPSGVVGVVIGWSTVKRDLRDVKERYSLRPRRGSVDEVTEAVPTYVIPRSDRERGMGPRELGHPPHLQEYRGKR